MTTSQPPSRTQWENEHATQCTLGLTTELDEASPERPNQPALLWRLPLLFHTRSKPSKAYEFNTVKLQKTQMLCHAKFIKLNGCHAHIGFHASLIAWYFHCINYKQTITSSSRYTWKGNNLCYSCIWCDLNLVDDFTTFVSDDWKPSSVIKVTFTSSSP